MLVFDWKMRPQQPTWAFRAVYTMQLIAVAAMLGGMLLIWWDAEQPQTYWDLVGRSARELRHRSVFALAQPLLTLWLLLPPMVAAILRGITGLLIAPVWFRKTAAASGFVALLALGHYYISFGDDLADNSPLQDGVIGVGFWLTLSSCSILLMLVLVEWVIPSYDGPGFVPQQIDQTQFQRGAWEAEFMTCPYCGALNDRRAGACFSCGNTLFSYEQQSEAERE